MTETNTLIIGAGPAGLAVAGHLHMAGSPYLMVEREQTIAASWRARYDRLHLHTVKELSHLPYRPFPPHFPRYVSRLQLIDYYEEYAKTMRIRPQLGQDVAHVTPTATGGWELHTKRGDRFVARQVVVATGFNQYPHRPTWPGMEQFTGPILHSSEYQNGVPFRGKRVLVIGMGNSGSEIALDLYEHGAKAILSVRSPVNMVLRDPMGRPAQRTALLLARLPHHVADRISNWLRRQVIGDLHRHGLTLPEASPLRQIREQGRNPVIDVGTLEQIKAGRIRVYSGVERFGQQTITFATGREVPFDAVILATGYRTRLSDFLHLPNEAVDAKGLPRHWQVPSLPGMYFCGFDPYRVGGLLRVIRHDSEKIAQTILARSTYSPQERKESEKNSASAA